MLKQKNYSNKISLLFHKKFKHRQLKVFNTFFMVSCFALFFTPINAANNYWEDAFGPTNNGGTGESYDGTVTAVPFLTGVGACAPYSGTACAALMLPPGEALDFDGVNDIVNAGDVDALDGISKATFEVWANFDELSGNRILISKGTNVNNRIAIQQFGSTLFFVVGDGQNEFGGVNNAVSANTWHHIVLVFDGTLANNSDRIKAYIDGVRQIFDGATTNNFPSLTNINAGDLTIGHASGYSFFSGQVDEVRIWTSARTCEEINYFKDCELAGTETDLEAYYQFNQGDAGGTNSSETTLNDLTANNNDGTLTNFDLTGSSSNWIAPGSVMTGSSCSGSPIYPEIAVNDLGNTDFGNVMVNTTSSLTYTITNSGVDVLTINDITSDDGQFVISNFTANSTVASGGGTITFDVDFTPLTTGAQSALISIDNDDCDENPYTFDVIGNGIPACDIAITSLSIENEICPGANDGEITVAATCGSCANGSVDIEYSIDGINFQTSNIFAGLIPNTYTITVRDINDLSCTNTDTGTVNAGIDTTNPTISCPANITTNTTPGICQANVDLIHATGNDNCGEVTITSDATINGVRYIRLTQNLAGFPINLAEFEAFQSGVNIAAGAIVTQSSNAGYPLTNFTDGNLTNFMHTLNGVGQWVEVDLGSEQNLEYIRVHNRGDACCGNRSESFILEYKDASNNVIQSNNDFDVYEGVNGPHFVDDGSNVYQLGISTITWTATDAVGNSVSCVQTVTVIDNENPAISTLADVTGECSATASTPTTTDNCAGTITGTTSDPLTYSTQGTHVIMWTFDDGNGNSISVNQNVIVDDMTAPTIMCPANIVTNTTPGICQANVDLIHATGNDNCGDVTITSDATVNGVRYIRLTQNLAGFPINLAEFEAFQSGVNIAAGAIVTQSSNAGYPLTNFTDGNLTNFMHTLNGVGQWVEVDLGSEQNLEYIRVHNRGDACCGNRSESFILEYKDASNNVIQSNNDFDVYEGVNGPHFVDDGSNVYQLGISTITWTATDAVGNSVSCVQTVTVIDNENPTITCPAAISISPDTGSCSASNPNIGTATATDNCNNATITNDAPAVFTLETTVVTYTADDNNGNEVTCTQTVTLDLSDFDNDGVCDEGDLDDDNDGILDTDECGNILLNGSMESYSQCPNLSTIGTINFADSWSTSHPTGGQLMVVDDVCNSNRPAGSWSVTTGLSGGSVGNNWLGLHETEDAQIILDYPLSTGVNYTITFDAGYVVQSPFVNPGVLTLYGVEVGDTDYSQTNLLGSSGDITNQLSNTNEVWQSYSFSFTASVDIDRILFVGNETSGGGRTYMYFDNLRLSGDAFSIACNDENTDLDLFPNYQDTDSDNDTCSDAIEAGHTDPDNDGVLGTSPVSVDMNGLVVGQGGYTGTTTLVTDDMQNGCNEAPIAICMDITVSADGNCQGTASAEDFDNTTTPSTDPEGDLLTFSVDPVGPYALGDTPVTVTVSDGNLSSTCTATITVEDNTDPTTPSLADVTGECSANTTAPTTSDNCAGTITGTTTDPLTYSTQGTHVIMWTFDDGNGNSITVNQNVIVDDVTNPVTPTLADVTGECSATATAPTTSDNCAGIITGTTTDPLTYSTQGTHVIVWTFDDGNGNSIMVNQNVIVDDITDPATPILADVTGECSATATAPTTTDNCSGTITGTTSDPLTYTTQGTHVIMWTFDDGNGNSITVNQNVIVDDVTNPATPTLADVTGECSATASTPTTTDNCVGTITGTTSDPLTYTTQGTHVIMWIFDDGNGNSITVNQNVIVDDVTNPATPTLADVTGECSATATAPTTTDNCVGTITGTTSDPLTYTTQGTHVIMWTFDDGNGNSISVNQNVIVDDMTAPTIMCPANIVTNTTPGICQANVDLIHATGNDNCGDVTITSDATVNGVRYIRLTQNLAGFPINLAEFEAFQSGVNIAAGAIVTQSSNAGYPLTNFTDGNLTNFMHTLNGVGQWVEVDLGSEQNLEYIRVHNRGDACCANRSESFILEYKDASNNVIQSNNDFDVYEGVNGPHFVDDGSNVYQLGTSSITWTATDAAGNSTSCVQTVTVIDNENPAIPTLADVTGECAATASTPTTTDNCAGTITGTTTAPLTYSTQGTHAIVWTFDDGNGNSITVNQNVIVDDVTNPVTPILADVTGECAATATAPTTTDNCAGTITGTTTDPLTYSTQGTHVIMWTFDDGNGNSITVNQNVIVDDVTNPVTPILDKVTGECSATATAPTTTDNCAGTITGTTTNPLTYSTQGTHVIVWTFDDGNGNSIMVNEYVIVDDITDPATPILADVTGECSATATAPTTTDNCSGTITGTTAAPLTYTTQGTHVIMWTFDDGNGNSITVNQNVIVDDVTNPAMPTLADVTGECSATVTAPTTTDNCSGTITGTTSDPLTYTTQGTHVIMWTFDDGNGNSIAVNQNVIVDDVSNPAMPTLADVTGECAATATAPTTTDNCSGTITGTTADPLTYTTQGTHVIMWTFDDGNGNSITVNQNVIVDDVTNPATPTLADVTGECSATATAPTTTDNCIGTITGTTSDPLTYTTQGTHVIMWTFDDGNGNSIAVNQNVIVDDVSNPAMPTLADVTGECAATATAPTTTDNCSGTITGTTADPLNYTTQGTHVIMWTFDDGNGNSITVNQNVIVDDVTNPATPTLADVTGECDATASTPTTTDNCVGTITGTTTAPLTYTTQGTHVIMWTFDDGNGNSITVNQNVIVDDVTNPVAPTLADVTGECSATVTAPTTTDNCSGTITGTTSDPLTYTTQGTHVIMWTFDDGNGNSIAVNQNVIVDDVTDPVITIDCPSDIELCGAQNVSWTSPEATDNCGAPTETSSHISGDYFNVGTTTVSYDFTDVGGNVISCSFNITIHSLPEVSILQNTVPDFCQGLVVLNTLVSNEVDLLLPLTYEWADGFGTGSEITATSNGTYEVSITDGNGCQTVVSTIVNGALSDALSAYIMIGKKEVYLKKYNTVNGGGVGVIQAGKKAKIKQNSHVYSFVKAPVIDKDGSSTIATEINGQADVTLPPFYENDSDCEEGIEVEEDQTLTLSGEVYGKIEVNEGGTLIIDSPEFYAEEIKTKKDATIEFAQSSSVMIEKDLKIDKNNIVSSNGYSVTFYVGKKAEVKEGTIFSANIYAEKEIKVKKAKSNHHTVMTGLFISLDKIKSEGYVDWYPSDVCDPSPTPDGASQCDDDDDDDDDYGFGGDKNDGKVELLLYPNPVVNELKVRFETEQADAKVQIIISDVLGRTRMIESGITIDGRNEILLDVNSLEIGTYLISVQIGKDHFNKIFVKMNTINFNSN